MNGPVTTGLKVWLASGSVMLKIDASFGSRNQRIPTGTVAGEARRSERSRVSLISSWERQKDACTHVMDTEEVFVTVPLMVMGVLGSPVGGVTEVIATLTNPEAVRAWAGDDPVTTVAKTINRPSSQAAGRRREGEGTSVMVVGRPASAVTIRKV